MIIDCPRCEAVVDAKELFVYEDKDEVEPPGTWTFCTCPKCTMPILTLLVPAMDGDDPPTRVFPPKKKALGWSVPTSLREAFNEARACFGAKAYTASAIMCRKTLEGLCDAHGVKEKTLAANLKKLKDKGIIETRLFEWAEALRAFGNEAAHGVRSTISRQDATDIIEFTEALTEYVFTYRDRFEQFKKRRDKMRSPAVAEEENL